jgi:acylphosphatase
MKALRKLRIEGKVQGVYYRKNTLEKAIELSICGFVQNESDGSVYVEAEGTNLQLDEFVEWCYIGSPLSKVTKIEIEESFPAGYNEFVIKI